MVQRLFSHHWQLAMSSLAGVVGASIMPGLLRRIRSKLLSGLWREIGVSTGSGETLQRDGRSRMVRRCSIKRCQMNSHVLLETRLSYSK
jgi:hypothetical protein